MYKDIVSHLINNNITISVAESLTGGLISKMITDVPGSSKIYKEGYVLYSNDAKVSILGVDKSVIDDNGVVSSEVAHEMAEKLFLKTGADICISTTGNAGPGVCDEKPVGRVYIGIAYNHDKKQDIKTFECNFSGEREDIRMACAQRVFEEIAKIWNS